MLNINLLKKNLPHQPIITILNAEEFRWATTVPQTPTIPLGHLIISIGLRQDRPLLALIVSMKCTANSIASNHTGSSTKRRQKESLASSSTRRKLFLKVKSHSETISMMQRSVIVDNTIGWAALEELNMATQPILPITNTELHLTNDIIDFFNSFSFV